MRTVLSTPRKWGLSAAPATVDELAPSRYADLRYRPPGRKVWRAQLRKARAAQRRARRQAVSA